MIRLAGANPICVFGDPENRFTVSRTALEQAATNRTKAILFNNPVNPTGTVYAKDELAEIVDFCKTQDLYLIADEVYGTFVYDAPFVSLYDFPDARERLILVNSASKSFAMAGLRLGWAVAPEPVASAIAGYLSHAVGCPCSLSERAAKAMLEGDEAFSLSLRDVFRKRRGTLFSLLTDIPGIRIHAAGAGPCGGRRTFEAICRAVRQKTTDNPVRFSPFLLISNKTIDKKPCCWYIISRKSGPFRSFFGME